MSRDRLWVALAILLPALAASIATVATGDLAYQVRAGELMIEKGDILRSDPFTFTAAGTRWLNQQWGTGILLALVHGMAGWAGIAILRTGLITSVVLLAYASARRHLAPRPAALVTLAGFVLGIGSLALRAQLLGLVCFVSILAIVQWRDRYPKTILLAPLVVVVWANVHGSFFLGPLLLGAAAFDDFWRARPTFALSAAAAAAGLVATVVGPLGLAVWEYAVSLSANPIIAARVSEWQRTSPLSGLGAAFYGSVAAVTAVHIRAWGRGCSILLGTAVVLTILAALGAYAERGVVWWALAAPALAAPALATLLPPATTVPRAESARLRRLNSLFVSVLVLVVVALQPLWRPSLPLTGPAGTLRDAPAGLPAALARLARPQDRVVVSQAWASWFEWAAPGIPVMVDSRVEVVPPSAWEDYLTIVQGGPDAIRLLDEIRATAVVVDPKEIPRLGATLRAAAGWQVAYEDHDGTIFVRRS